MELKESKEIWLKMERERAKVLPAARESFRRALFMQIEPLLQALERIGQVYDYDAILNAYIQPDAIKTAYLQVYRKVGFEFAQRQFRESNKKNLKQEEFQNNWFAYFDSWIEQEAGDMIVGVTETTKQIAKDVLTSANQEGLGIFAQAELLRERWSEISFVRAERIARTETITASNLGSLQGAQATGLALQKVWIPTFDSRTRDAHLNVQPRQIGMKQDWTVGGFPAQYPGDPKLPAGERINCRCTLSYEENEARQESTTQNNEVLPNQGLFTPAKTIQEADERLSRFGKVQINDISLESKNQILQASEEILGMMPDKKLINGFIYQKDNIKSIARARIRTAVEDESIKQGVSIEFKKTFLKNPVSYTKKQAETFQKSIEYRKSEIEKFLKIPNLPKDVIQRRLDALEEINTYKSWAVMERSNRPLYSVAVHENGHVLYNVKNLNNRWRDNLKRNNVQAIDKRLVSEYGASDIEELFCETLSAYKSDVQIPDNIKKALLETIN